jgi:hypothetical protein
MGPWEGRFRRFIPLDCLTPTYPSPKGGSSLPAAGMPCYGAVEKPFWLTLTTPHDRRLIVAPPARDGAERLDSEG